MSKNKKSKNKSKAPRKEVSKLATKKFPNKSNAKSAPKLAKLSTKGKPAKVIKPTKPAAKSQILEKGKKLATALITAGINKLSKSPTAKLTAKKTKLVPAADKNQKNLKKNKKEDFDDLVPDDEILIDAEDLSALDELEDAADPVTPEEEVKPEVIIQAATLETTSLIKEMVLTDPEGRPLCRVRDCDQAALVEGYCRYHYLLQWKKIQVRRRILIDGKLQKYVDELTSRYPDKFLEMLKKDLRSEKDFQGAIAELDIDEAAIDQDMEDESQTFIDEVRGVTPMGMEDEESF